MSNPYIELPEWTYADSDNSIYSFVSAVCLSGQEGKWFKLKAEDQRRITGKNRFNRLSIGVFDGQLHIGRSVCFGTDFNIVHVIPEMWDADLVGMV